MKQFKCNTCARSWYVEDEELNSVIVCPFCRTPTRQKGEIYCIDTLGKAIYKAISDRGIDILSSIGRISGYLLDIVPDLKKEVHIFSKTFDDHYISVYQTVFGRDMKDVILTMNRLRSLFIEEEGLSVNWADMICDNCRQAALYYNGDGLEDIISVEIIDVPFSVESVKYFKGRDSVSKLVRKFDDFDEGFVLTLGEPFRNLKKLMCLDYNVVCEHKHISIPLDVDMLYFHNILVIPEETIINCHNVKIICISANIQVIEKNAFAKFEKLEYLIFLSGNNNRKIFDKTLLSNSENKKVYCSLKDDNLRSQCTYCRCFDNKYSYYFYSEKEAIKKIIVFCDNYLGGIK